MPQFSTVKPYAVFFATIYDDSAFSPEIYPVHDLAADRAFDVGYSVVDGFRVVDTVQAAPVYREDIGHSRFQERFQFIRIKEEPKALLTSFDQEFTVYFQVDGFQADTATWAGSLRFTFMSRKVIYPFKVDIVAATAVVASD
jgi:hypothetical protein